MPVEPLRPTELVPNIIYVAVPSNEPNIVRGGYNGTDIPVDGSTYVLIHPRSSHRDEIATVIHSPTLRLVRVYRDSILPSTRFRRLGDDEGVVLRNPPEDLTV